MGRSKKVLVLEDEAIVQRVIQRFGSLLNLETLAATSVAEAIEIVDNQDIGLGFLDYQVEGPQNGDVVAAYLQQRKIPMIIISSGAPHTERGWQTPQTLFVNFDI